MSHLSIPWCLKISLTVAMTKLDWWKHAILSTLAGHSPSSTAWHHLYVLLIVDLWTHWRIFIRESDLLLSNHHVLWCAVVTVVWKVSSLSCWFAVRLNLNISLVHLRIYWSQWWQNLMCLSLTWIWNSWWQHCLHLMLLFHIHWLLSLLFHQVFHRAGHWILLNRLQCTQTIIVTHIKKFFCFIIPVIISLPLLWVETGCFLHVIEFQSTHMDGFNVLLLWCNLDILWFRIVYLLNGLVLHGLSLVDLLLELHVVVFHHLLL